MTSTNQRVEAYSTVSSRLLALMVHSITAKLIINGELIAHNEHRTE